MSEIITLLSSMHQIILISPGSAEALNLKSTKEFLSRFLFDDNVVKMPLKEYLLPLIISRRAPKLLKIYQSIEENGKSPLSCFNASLTAHVNTLLPDNAGAALGCLYSRPYFEEVLEKTALSLKGSADGAISLITLSPFMSTATHETPLNLSSKILRKLKFDGRVYFDEGFYDDEGFFKLHYQNIERFLEASAKQGREFDVLLISVHGLPQSYVKDNPFYSLNCDDFALKLQAALPQIQVRLSFQSKFGPMPWLRPCTGAVLKDLAKNGKRVAVYCPGFMGECSETLHEVADVYQKLYYRCRGRVFAYIPQPGAFEYAKVLAPMILKRSVQSFAPAARHDGGAFRLDLEQRLKG